MASLDFALVDGLQYRVDNRLCGLRERYLANDERLGIQLFNLGSYLDDATTLSVIVFRYVYRTTCGEVWIQVELLAMQVGDSCVADFYEVLG